MPWRPSTTEQQLLHLNELAKRVADHFGDARDVEWAIVEHQVYVLQARPIVVPHILPATSPPTAKARQPSTQL